MVWNSSSGFPPHILWVSEWMCDIVEATLVKPSSHYFNSVKPQQPWRYTLKPWNLSPDSLNTVVQLRVRFTLRVVTWPRVGVPQYLCVFLEGTRLSESVRRKINADSDLT